MQFTYWKKDARIKAGVSGGSGWALSTAYELDEGLFPFIRIGHSDGGAGVAAEEAVSIGAQMAVKIDQIWSFGAGWAKPSEKTYGPALDEETVLETSYKLQLSKNSNLTPDVQYMINPANNPEKNSLWVAGIRMRLVS